MMLIRGFSRSLLLVAVVLSTMCSGFATAAESSQSAEELALLQLMQTPVFGASRFEQKMSEAPASVSVVTGDEIRKYGYRTLADVLRAQRGFYVTNDRAYSYVGVRGFGRTGDYNTRILLLVDGHRTNENLYDATYFAMESIVDLDLVDRVEVIRGPGSSLYGDNAFFAVVNVLMKRGRDLDGLEGSAGVGTLETYQGRLAWGKRFANGLEALVSGFGYRSEGNRRLYYKEFDDPSTHDGVAENLDAERTGRLFLRASLGDFSMEGAFVTRNKKVPTASFEAVFDSLQEDEDNRGYVNVRYEPHLGWLGDLAVRVFYDYYDYYELSKYDMGAPGVPDIVVNKDTASNQWGGTEVHVTKAFGKGAVLVAGTEYQRNFSQRLENHDRDPYAQYLDIDRQSDKWAVYGQLDAEVLRGLRVNAGVRYDRFENFGGTLNPRAAVVYEAVTGTVIKALYGQAFRAPNLYELAYGAVDFGLRGNPDLEPEKIRTYEVAWEQVLGEHARFTAAAFLSRIRELIYQAVDPADGALVFENIGSVEAKGVELEVEGRGPYGAQARGSYTYQLAVDQDTGQSLVNSPRHMLKGNVSLPLWKERLILGIEEQYLSPRLTLAGRRTGDVLLTNLTLFSHGLLPGLELSATVSNLFNARYGDPAGGEHRQDEIRQDGRTMRLTATYNY